jgi:hypothetical protein
MSKAIEATCVGGVVTAAEVAVPDVNILSAGVGESEGLLILDETDATYITSNAEDIESAIDDIASALNTIASTLTAIAANMVGAGTSPPPSLPSNVTEILSKVTSLNLLKESLK